MYCKKPERASCKKCVLSSNTTCGKDNSVKVDALVNEPFIK